MPRWSTLSMLALLSIALVLYLAALLAAPWPECGPNAARGCCMLLVGCETEWRK